VSWCDKLASTPGLGVRLDKLYAPISTLLEPLTPVVSTWIDRVNDRPAFTIDQPQDLFSGNLTTIDGFRYVFGYETFAVEFQHRMRFRAQSAGPPTAELMSKPAPYSDLLNNVTERLLEMMRLVTNAATVKRKLLRIGVTSTTVVTEDEMPPGIKRFVKHVAKPWDTSLDSFHVDVTAKLPNGKNTTRFDRCTHVVTKPEDSEGLTTIRLDWQRFLTEDRTLSMGTLSDLIEQAKTDALVYFEDIGEGARFDE
jgi:hypothetical protein